MNPTYPKFTFDQSLTIVQIDFFKKNGFIHFESFIGSDTVYELIESLEDVQDNFVEQKVEVVNGIPLKYGKDENGKTIIHRIPFTSQYCAVTKSITQDPRLQALKVLMPSGARIAENEKDGVVTNHYVNTESSNFKQMGWHTDSMRDIFYGKKILPMLNIGLYMDDSSDFNGGLRIIPGTHQQNIFNMLFRKAYFLNNEEDKNEVLVQAKKGDLVIHDGRIWHRVAQSPFLGAQSRRRVMYIPMIVGKYMPKTEESFTPFYHRFQKLVG